MREILRDAGALDENGDMKRVLTDVEKKNINEGVASKLEELCQRYRRISSKTTMPSGTAWLLRRDSTN